MRNFGNQKSQTPMKYVSLILLLLLIPLFGSAQPDADRQSMLWEVSGNGLPGNSYLYGSAHLNDPSLFNFGDSVYYALRSCEQFAGEVNFAQLDSVLADMLLEYFFAGAEGRAPEDSTGSAKNDMPFGQMDMQGKATIVDCYLYRAAMNLGLSSHGLENMDEHTSLLDGLPADNRKYDRRSTWYREFIDAYAMGDLDLLQEMIDSSLYRNGDPYQMVKRNQIQATSFIELAQKAGTFAVVGVAHLFGDSNVPELLRRKGYTVRRVKQGAPTTALDELFDRHQDTPWHDINGQVFNFTLQSHLPYEPVSVNEYSEFHFGTEFDKGLVYMTMALSSEVISDEIDLLSFAIDGILPDTLALKKSRTVVNDNLIRYDLENFSSKNAYKARLYANDQVYLMQLIFGLSASALDHPNVNKYLDGLTIRTELPPVPKAWNEQFDAEGNFTYYFPDDIPFQVNTVNSQDYQERGEVSLNYKVYKDPENDNEYMVRYHCMPPGITFIEPYEDLNVTMKYLASLYRGEVREFTYFSKDGYLGADAIVVDTFDNHFYVRELIRGAMMYILVQKSPERRRNTRFFESLTFNPPVFRTEHTFIYPEAGFSMKTPKRNYHYQSTDEDVITENYDFNYEDSGVVLLLEFEPYSKYEELNLSDSIFSLTNILGGESVDTVFSYKTFRYGDVCPAYKVVYQNDSTAYDRTVYGVFCNHHFTSMEIVSPEPMRSTSFVDDLLGSIEIRLNDRSGTSLTTRKADLILADLEAKDSLTFYQALEAFSAYDDFRESDLARIYPLLWKPLLNEIEAYNAKYLMVKKLHDFESPEVEDELVKYYSATDNDYVQALILESLGRRSSPTSMPKLFGLLNELEPDRQLFPELFMILQDSAALMEQYYPDLKQLAEKRIGEPQILALIAYWLEQEGALSFLEKDQSWYHPRMYAQIDSFYVALAADTSASIDGYLMDYIREKGDPEKTAELYAVLAKSPDIFGKYRIIYNLIATNQSLPQELMDTVMTSEYYRYWVVKGLDIFDRSLPDRWNQQKDIADAIIKYHYYTETNYWCDSCTVIREISASRAKPGNMLFMKCLSELGDGYYLGCIGPFDEQGHFDPNNDQSVYFTETVAESDFEKILLQFLEYMNGE